MKKLLLAVAAGSVMLAVSGAPSFADVCTGTCTDSAGAINPNGTIADNGILAGSAVTDTFSFSLVAPPSAFNEAADTITVPDGSITNLKLALYSGAPLTGTLIASNNVALFTTVGGITLQTISLAVNGVAASVLGLPYYWEVTGTNSVAPAGLTTLSYSGNISTVAGSNQETPLPAALPLFAAGLGLLGATGLMRRKKAARAAFAA